MGPFWVSRDQKRPGWDPLMDPLPKKAMMFIAPGMATFPKVSSNSVPNILTNFLIQSHFEYVPHG